MLITNGRVLTEILPVVESYARKIITGESPFRGIPTNSYILVRNSYGLLETVTE